VGSAAGRGPARFSKGPFFKSGDWLADIRGAIPNEGVCLGERGSTAKAGAILGHADAGSQSTRQRAGKSRATSNSTRHGTQPAGRLVTVDPASARPCSSRDDVRLQASSRAPGRSSGARPLAREEPGERRPCGVAERSAEDDGRTDGGVKPTTIAAGRFPGWSRRAAARRSASLFAQPARHDLAREAHLLRHPLDREHGARVPAVSSPLSSCALTASGRPSSRSVFVIAGRLFPPARPVRPA